MRYLYVFVVITMFLIPCYADASETKKVCIDKITNDGKKVLDKQGKPLQECREIKVHKKLEETRK